MTEPPKLGRPPRRSEETTKRLRQDIARGRFAASEALPGERQLAEILQVSRTTLRRALAELIAEGILVQRQGLGTVINKAADPVGNAKTILKTDYSTIGLNIEVTSVRDVSSGFDDADPDEALMLAAPPGQMIYRSVRVLLADDRPVAVESEAAPQRFLANSGPPTRAASESLVLNGEEPTEAITRLRAVRLSGEEARTLDIDRSTPAVSVQKALYLADGRCCAVIRILFPVNLLDFVAIGRLG